MFATPALGFQVREALDCEMLGVEQPCLSCI
jgi:hypothetical protein